MICSLLKDENPDHWIAEIPRTDFEVEQNHKILTATLSSRSDTWYLCNGPIVQRFVKAEMLRDEYSSEENP